MSYNYEPLFRVLNEKDITINKMTADIGLSSRTVAKFRKRESVTIETLSKIYRYLQVPIEDIVEIEYRED